MVVGKRRAVSLRRPQPTAIQSRAKPCVETAMKATQPRLPFPAGQGFSSGRAGVIWRGERPTARDSGMDTSLVTYFHSQAILS